MLVYVKERIVVCVRITNTRRLVSNDERIDVESRDGFVRARAVHPDARRP